MTTHTPGPWTADHHQIRDAEGNAIASVPYNLGGPEDRANAALITAAPELLAALDFLTRAAEAEPCMAIYKAHIAQARAAIARAKGEATQ